jgi:CheY-like chemotaxis protein
MSSHVICMMITKKSEAQAEKKEIKGKKPAPEGPVKAEKALTILLVDDYKNTLRTLEATVSGLGHNPKTARNGEEALRLYMKALERCSKGYKEDRIDLVITDYRMPGMDGFELLKKLKSLDPGAKVILATAYGKILDKESIVSAGAVAVLDKPLDRDDIKKVIDAVGCESQNP